MLDIIPQILTPTINLINRNHHGKLQEEDWFFVVSYFIVMVIQFFGAGVLMEKTIVGKYIKRFFDWIEKQLGVCGGVGAYFTVGCLIMLFPILPALLLKSIFY